MSALEDGRVTLAEFSEATSRLSRAIAGIEAKISPEEREALERLRLQVGLRRAWIKQRRALLATWAAGVALAAFGYYCDPGAYVVWLVWQVYFVQRWRAERAAFAELKRLEPAPARLLLRGEGGAQ